MMIFYLDKENILSEFNREIINYLKINTEIITFDCYEINNSLISFSCGKLKEIWFLTNRAKKAKILHIVLNNNYKVCNVD